MLCSGHAQLEGRYRADGGLAFPTAGSLSGQVLDGREREAGVQGGAYPDGWWTVSRMNETLMGRIDNENVGE